MTPIDFPEANTSYGPPRGMEESQIRTIRAWIGEIKSGSCDGLAQTVIAWRPSEEERKAIMAGADIYLSVIGCLPPHFLTTSFEETQKIA